MIAVFITEMVILHTYIFYTRVSTVKDNNDVAHSVDSDIIYVVINLSARSKSYIKTFILKVHVVSNCGV